MELKLKHKLRKSAAAAADDDAGGSGQQLQYQPAQLDRFSSQHNKRRKQDNKVGSFCTTQGCTEIVC